MSRGKREEGGGSEGVERQSGSGTEGGAGHGFDIMGSLLC